MMVDRVLALKIQVIPFSPLSGTLWRSCRWVVNKERILIQINTFSQSI